MVSHGAYNERIYIIMEPRIINTIFIYARSFLKLDLEEFRIGNFKKSYYVLKFQYFFESNKNLRYFHIVVCITHIHTYTRCYLINLDRSKDSKTCCVKDDR